MPIVRRTLEECERLGRIDQAKFDATTEEDIKRQIAEDPDTAPELSDEELRNMRRVDYGQAMRLRETRKRLGLSQAEFASRYGFTEDKVRAWEEGEIATGAERILLRLIERFPESVDAVLD